MVLGSPLLHALSGLARARLGWLCPRAWGGELVVRVSNRLVRRAVGCLHSSGSVRSRGVLTGGCLAAGLTTASMALTVAQDSWHSLHSVWHAQSVKEKCKGYQGCLQRGCFDLNCPRGNRCPLWQTQRRKAAQNQGA